MTRQPLDDAGRLLLRLSIGGLLLFHGVAKVAHGVGRIATQLSEHGIPRFVSFGVYVGEVVAPVLVLAGIGSRIGALVIVVNMLVAIALSHTADLTRLTRGGGWGVELQMLYVFAAVAIALLGAGRYSISRGRGRWD